jgi:23S rRNA pseudouridine1911/1915/1917 synthase
MKRLQPFRIVYEDDDIIVVDKASGIAVIADHWDDSLERLDELVGDLLKSRAATNAKHPAVAPDKSIYVVHRVDRDTSGLVAFAKTAEMHKTLSSAFEARLVKKRYIAVINGRPTWTETSCDLPLRMDGDREHRTIVDRGHGKPALTEFKVLGICGNLAVLEAFPHTGRTHQIRAHLSALGHSIVCDPLYGDKKPLLLSSFKRSWRGDPYEERPILSRLGLHASSLSFEVPELKQRDFSAPLAKDMAALLSQMEKITGEDFGASKE